jgi:broad specificity phosphatase PhoE
MTRLVLVRHARVHAEHDKPHNLWGLTREGRCDAGALADDPAVNAVTLFASSYEPKAVETAAAVARGRPIVKVEDLGELDRSAAGWIDSDEERLGLVQAIFDRPADNIGGCESAAHALTRFTRAVDGLVAEYPKDELAIVSHGTVLALYMAHLRGLVKADFEAWRRIRLPDVAVVDTSTRRVMRDFGATGR